MYDDVYKNANNNFAITCFILIAYVLDYFFLFFFIFNIYVFNNFMIEFYSCFIHRHEYFSFVNTYVINKGVCVICALLKSF